MKEEKMIEGYKVEVVKTKTGYIALIADLGLKVRVKKKEEIEPAVILMLNSYFRELYSLPEKKSRLNFFKVQKSIKEKKQKIR